MCACGFYLKLASNYTQLGNLELDLVSKYTLLLTIAENLATTKCRLGLTGKNVAVMGESCQSLCPQLGEAEALHAPAYLTWAAVECIL